MLSKNFLYSNIIGVLIIIVASAFITLFSWIYKKNKRLTTNITITMLILAFAFSYIYTPFYSNIEGYSFSILNKNIASFLILLLIVIIISTKDFIEKIKFGEYYFLQLMSLLGTIFMINSTNLFSIFLAVEFISIVLYGVVIYHKTEENIKASIKYFILGSFATMFMILSLVFFYIHSNTLEITELYKNQNLYISFALSLFISSLIFKIALVPFHLYAVDIYWQAPTDITMTMTSYIKLAFILTLYNIFLSYPHLVIKNFFYVFIILTMIIPNIVALFINDIKKIIVYSSISHAGYIVSSFLGPERYPVYFYTFVYSITTVGVFSIIALIEKNYKTFDIELLKGLYKKSPFVSISLAVFLFSLSGLPPFSGFFAKFYSFYNASLGGYNDIVVLGVVTSGISLYYYIKILIPVFMEEEIEKSKDIVFSYNNSFVIAITAIIVVIAGLLSGNIIDWFKIIY